MFRKIRIRRRVEKAQKERTRQLAMGYTPQHDYAYHDAHSLITMAFNYQAEGKTDKAMASMLSSLELLSYSAALDIAKE